ncbi:MAG: ORF6N domain-containing protein [Bacteroidales bacterium]|nr:ORF6N domain-containing protein [Bacteroidales bacterium]
MDKKGIEISSDLKIDNIKNTFFDIRGKKVLLDRDLAAIYGVETRALNQAVKRNIDRFLADFMFQLTPEEWKSIENRSNMSSQSVMTLPSRRPKSSLPFAFTEYGAVMLASVLKSQSAVLMSVMVTRAFIAMRQAIIAMHSMDFRFEQLNHKVDQLNSYIEEILHDQNDVNEQQEITNNEIAIQIEAINDALDKLLNNQSKPRRMIGFKTED